MASCVASARCLASPVARTAASSPALGGVRSPGISCPWRHVDLQEDHDLAAEHAPKRASDHRNVGERIRTVDLDETEALGPPTDDGPPTGFSKRAGSCNDVLSAACCLGLPAKDEVCLAAGRPHNASSNWSIFW